MAPWNEHLDGPVEQAFEQCCQLDQATKTWELRRFLVEIVKAWTDHPKTCVIIQNHSQTHFLAMEFFGPNKCSIRGDEPWIQLEYVSANDMSKAQNFLSADEEDILFLTTLDENVNDLDRHVFLHSTLTGEYDDETGCELLEGFLVPMKAEVELEAPKQAGEWQMITNAVALTAQRS